MHPLIMTLFKVGTTGAGIMAGTTIVVEGAKKVASFLDDKVLGEQFGFELEPVIAGPLDSIGTLLDPLDLTGTRARKEKAQKEREAAAKRKAKREARAKKRAQKAANAAEQRAAEAEAKAAQLEQQAREAEARAATAQQAAEAAQKRQKAVKMGRWAGMAKAAAKSAKTQAPADPTASEKIALAALDMAKAAMNPPNSAQGILADPNMSPEQKSLLADIVDEANRLGPPPAIDAILSRMWAGAGAASLAAASALEDGGGDYDDDDEVDGPVNGPDDDEGEKPVKQARSMIQELVDDPDEPAAEVSGSDGETIVEGCCSSCGMGSPCEGGAGRVEGDMLDGSIVDGSDDDDDDDDVVSGDIFGAADEDDDDDGEVSGPENASLYGFPILDAPRKGR